MVPVASSGTMTTAIAWKAMSTESTARLHVSAGRTLLCRVCKTLPCEPTCKNHDMSEMRPYEIQLLQVGCT